MIHFRYDVRYTYDPRYIQKLLFSLSKESLSGTIASNSKDEETE